MNRGQSGGEALGPKPVNLSAAPWPLCRGHSCSGSPSARPGRAVTTQTHCCRCRGPGCCCSAKKQAVHGLTLVIGAGESPGEKWLLLCKALYAEARFLEQQQQHVQELDVQTHRPSRVRACTFRPSPGFPGVALWGPLFPRAKHLWSSHVTHLKCSQQAWRPLLLPPNTSDRQIRARKLSDRALSLQDKYRWLLRGGSDTPWHCCYTELRAATDRTLRD